MSRVRSRPIAPITGKPSVPISPSPVGVGDDEPRPAVRQPLAQARSRSIGESPKLTICPTSGTPRVRRWRLPATSTRSTAAHTVADTRRLPRLHPAGRLPPAARQAGEAILAPADLPAQQLAEPGAAAVHVLAHVAVGDVPEPAHLLAGLAQLAEPTEVPGPRRARRRRRAWCGRR